MFDPTAVVAAQLEFSVLNLLVGVGILACLVVGFFTIVLGVPYYLWRRVGTGKAGSRSHTRSERYPKRTAGPVRPGYTVAAGSLDLASERDDGRRFEHAIVGSRGEDLVVEVEDDERSARFLVRSTPRGERLVSPAESVDRRHGTWTASAEEYLGQATLSGDLETE